MNDARPSVNILKIDRREGSMTKRTSMNLKLLVDGH
jgi:hypothetical protein